MSNNYKEYQLGELGNFTNDDFYRMSVRSPDLFATVVLYDKPSLPPLEVEPEKALGILEKINLQVIDKFWSLNVRYSHMIDSLIPVIQVLTHAVGMITVSAEKK